MSKSREDFEVWFKTTKAYLMLKEANYFKEDLFKFIEPRCAYLHIFVDISFMTWQEQQKKLDAVQAVVADLQEELKDFVETDLYDKGYKRATKAIKHDLEKALQGDTNA